MQLVSTISSQRAFWAHIQQKREHRVRGLALKSSLSACLISNRITLRRLSASCSGLVKGAQLASSGIRRGSELIAEKIQPVTAPIAVDPKVKVGIDVAKKGSKAAVVAGEDLVYVTLWKCPLTYTHVTLLNLL